VTESAKTMIEIQVEPLPFTEVTVEHPDELLRQWIFREVQSSDVATSKVTIEYMESVYQWIKQGQAKAKIKAVE